MNTTAKISNEFFKQITFWFVSQHKVGPVKVKSFFEESGRDLQIFADRIIEVFNLKREDLDKIQEIQIPKNALFFWEDIYPDNLKNTPDLPIILYFKGEYNLAKLSNLISIVGTRNLSEYGKQVCKQFVPDLVKSGAGIVSGMALGIDALAHEFTLDNNGFTVAVLASNIDTPTPTSNTKLYKRILDNGGLILSENNTNLVEAYNFVSRNRIVAGLSNSTLVIEAGEKSGALITANLAFDYGREVYAVPGKLNSEKSSGTNFLIKNNIAKLVQSPQDIFSEIKPVVKNQNFTQNEFLIIQKIKEFDNGATIDKLLGQLNIPFTEILDNLTNLELNGIIQKKNDKYYLT